jgi:hypothetical protein
MDAPATLLFTETAGAGVYTAAVGIAANGIVQAVNLLPFGLWAAATVVLDMGDDLTAADSYFSAYDVTGMSATYDPTSPTRGTNFESLSAGNDYVRPIGNNWPGIVYVAGDVLTAVITTTGGGGTTGLLAVQVTGYGIPSVVHHAVKV